MRAHAERASHIDPHTARTRWRGESMGYDIAIDVLRAKERKADDLRRTNEANPRS